MQRNLICPKCETKLENRGKLGVEGIGFNQMIARQYRCPNCKQKYESVEILTTLDLQISLGHGDSLSEPNGTK